MKPPLSSRSVRVTVSLSRYIFLRLSMCLFVSPSLYPVRRAHIVLISKRRKSVFKRVADGFCAFPLRGVLFSLRLYSDGVGDDIALQPSRIGKRWSERDISSHSGS